MRLVTRQKKLGPQQRQLLELFEQLDAAGRTSLLDYAGFLASRSPEPPAVDEADSGVPQQPKPIPRPPNESVVKAIKRLSASYYMLERDRMLDETSSLMMAHVMQGRDAAAVIDDLERLFEQHYRRYLETD